MLSTEQRKAAWKIGCYILGVFPGAVREGRDLGDPPLLCVLGGGWGRWRSEPGNGIAQLPHRSPHSQARGRRCTGFYEAHLPKAGWNVAFLKRLPGL